MLTLIAPIVLIGVLAFTSLWRDVRKTIRKGDWPKSIEGFTTSRTCPDGTRTKDGQCLMDF